MNTPGLSLPSSSGLAAATNAPKAPNVNWNGGGNSIASGYLQQATPSEQNESTYAQGLATYYGQVGAEALNNQAPTIASANGAQLAASRGQYGANANAYGALAGAYGQVASGQGPMGQLAQNQFNQASGQAIDANLAMAHSATGGAVAQAGAERAAQQQNAQQQGGMAGQSAILAAQQQQAGLAGQAGAYAGQANAYGQAGAQNLSQYQIEQQVRQSQASLQQAQLGQNEQFYQNMATTGANQQQIANQATESLAGLGIQAGLGEAGTAVGAQNATTSMVGTGSTIGTGVASMIGGGFGSDENAKIGIQAEGNSNLADTPVSHAATGGESTILSSGATTSQEAGDIGVGALKGAGKGAGIGGLIGSILPGVGNAIGAGVGAAIGAGVGAYTGGQGNVDTSGTTAGGVTQTADTSGGPTPGGAVGGGLGAIGAAGSIASDEDEKIGADGHVSLVDQFLRSIHPYSYEYRNPADEPRAGGPTGGRYLGVMAQDLERVPAVGHQLVTDTPSGKRISTGAGLSAALAGLARLNERVSAVEGK